MHRPSHSIKKRTLPHPLSDFGQGQEVPPALNFTAIHDAWVRCAEMAERKSTKGEQGSARGQP
jgi:hypothetical protein